MISQDERDKRDRQDMQSLVERPEFTRFLLRVIQQSKIFSRTTDGSSDQLLLNEGGRQLGLVILSWAEQAQPAAHPDLPIFTMLQISREEAIQPQPQQETSGGQRRKERFDRNAEFDDTDDTNEDDPS